MVKTTAIIRSDVHNSKVFKIISFNFSFCGDSSRADLKTEVKVYQRSFDCLSKSRLKSITSTYRIHHHWRIILRKMINKEVFDFLLLFIFVSFELRNAFAICYALSIMILYRLLAIVSIYWSISTLTMIRLWRVKFYNSILLMIDWFDVSNCML